MKLSEALVEKSYLSTKLNDLKDRLLVNGKVQEGDTSPENVTDLFAELNHIINQLEDISKKIVKTNNKSNLSVKLIEKEMMEKKINILKFTIDNCQVKSDRYSRTEIKMVTTFDLKKTREIMEDLIKKKRALDMSIQETNWKTELEN